MKKNISNSLLNNKVIILLLLVGVNIQCEKDNPIPNEPVACHSFVDSLLYHNHFYGANSIDEQEILSTMEGYYIYDTTVCLVPCYSDSSRAHNHYIHFENYQVELFEKITNKKLAEATFTLEQNKWNPGEPYLVRLPRSDDETFSDAGVSLFGWVMPCESWMVFSTEHVDGASIYYRPYDPEKD